MAESNTVSSTTLFKLLAAFALIGSFVFAGGILYAQTNENVKDIVEVRTDVKSNTEKISETSKLLGIVKQQFVYIERAQNEQKALIEKVLDKLGGTR